MPEQTATNPQTGERVVFRNGQWVPMGSAPAAQPVQPRQPDITVLSGPAQPSPIELENLRLRQEAAQRAAEEASRNAQGNPGVGYRINAQGNAEPIPGGPADPNRPQPGREGNSIPLGAANRAETDIGSFTALSRAVGGFQNDYAGNAITGDLENSAQAVLGTGTPGQSEWWADFRTLDNQIRNDLFGATLTPSEQQAYARTSITPRMTPEKVRANLQRRLQIVRDALTRRRDFYLAQGYRQEAVDALFAPLLESQFANEQGQQQDRTPPALGGAVGGGSGGSGAPPAGGPQTPPTVGPSGDGRILGNTHNYGLDTEQQAIARSSRARQDDPLLGGIQAEYLARLGRGDSAEAIVEWARSTGINQSALPSIAEQVRFRDANPDVPLTEYDVSQLDDRFVNVDPLAQGLGNVSAMPVGAYFANAADALSGFNLDSLIGATGGNAEQARAAIAQTQQENPVSSLAGTLSGGVMAALGGEAALGRAGVAAGLGRAAAADSAYGAIAGAGMTDYGADGAPATATDRLIGAGTGAAAGAAGSFAGQRLGNALAAGARGVGNQAVQAMRREGVPLTVGQQFGGSGRMGQAVRAVEDRLTGVPVVGDAINARRTEGLRRFNSRVFDRVLEPIGGQVGDLVGADAVEEAQRQVSQAFRDALDGVGIIPDSVFERDLGNAVTGLRSIENSAPGITDDVAEVFAPYANDQMLTGEALQTIHRELRDIRLAYRQNPRFRRISAQVEKVERAVFDVFDRQASGTVENYRLARQAYRRLATVEDAVIKATNQQDQMFTPAQLGRQDATSTRRLEGRGAAARGAGPFNDLTTAGQEVLPNKVPDSGTAGRVLIPALALGAGGGIGQQTGNPSMGLTIGAILGGVYTKMGQRALTRMGAGTNNQTVRNALESKVTRRALGLAGAGGALSATQP